MSPIPLRSALLQRLQRGGFPRQGRARLFLHWHRPGGVIGAALLVQQGGPHILRRADVRRDCVQAGDDRLLLLGAFLALPQAQRHLGGRRLDHGDACPIRLHDQDGVGGGQGGSGAWLGVEGRHILRVLPHARFERLDTQIQPQDARDGVGGLTIRAIGGIIARPVPQQVGIAARRHAQIRIQGAAPVLVWCDEIVAREPQCAKDRAIGGHALVVIGQHGAIRRCRGRGARSGPRDKKQPQQGGSQRRVPSG